VTAQWATTLTMMAIARRTMTNSDSATGDEVDDNGDGATGCVDGGNDNGRQRR